jgi:hypothetical protein
MEERLTRNEAIEARKVADVEIARLLSSGRAITNVDVKGVYGENGLAPGTASGFIGAVRGGAFVERTGVQPRVVKFRCGPVRNIYLDSELGEEDTDIDEVRERISVAQREYRRRLWEWRKSVRDEREVALRGET